MGHSCPFLLHPILEREREREESLENVENKFKNIFVTNYIK